jgi:hypothetical protein
MNRLPQSLLICLLIALIASSAQSADKPEAKRQNKQIRVAAPLKRPWMVVFRDADFRVFKNELSDEGRVSGFHGVNAATRLSVVVFMEPAQDKNDTAKTVRDAYWGQTKSSYKVQDVKLWEQDDAALVAYTRTDIAGKLVLQRNLEAFYVHDGIWVDIKVSKLQFRDDDLPEMEAMLKTVAFHSTEKP